MSNISKLTANYHTHTSLCGHARGEIREYVNCAIRAGMKTLGFACHAPYSFPGDRMPPEDVEIYSREIFSLKEEFGDKIDIKLGYEAEYYPKHFKELLDCINAFGCDYIILGQHYSNNEYDGRYAGCLDNVERLEGYVDQVCEAMGLGVFTYVAHPDLPRMHFAEDEYYRIMSRICEMSVKTDTPLEINLNGIMGGKQYPKEPFWKMAGEYGCPVVMGVDAHYPEALLDESPLVRAFEFVEKYSLNYTGNNIVLKRPIL